ncbi:MAG: sensor hybrid histidine kinase [Nitrospirae bacterium]|nr:sensor hybrid histidine kinase [Nitrospirota bacterium]
MTREAYIRKKLDDNFQLWCGRASLWGCFLFLSLGVLDYLATPENFFLFLRYRAVVSLVLLAGYFFTWRLPKAYLSMLAYAMVASAAIAIELMILNFGGHESPYYVGMILLGISVVGFIPARFSFHIIIAIMIYTIYLFPILIIETITGHRDFVIANAFMVLIFSTMLLMRYMSGNALAAELGLQYDLEQYRERLEMVVEERTAELRHAVKDLKKEIVERQRAEAERKLLQAQLLQAQKMESIGRLAGGVAHDFNNILTAILSYAELSLMKLPEHDPLRGHLISIQEASEKAATLTHQLLAFSRRQVLEMKVVDLNDVIRGLAKMLTRMIGEDMPLELRTGATASFVRADEGQIEQVLMNLAVNARDAMPSGGRLVIETADANPDDAVLKSQGVADPGQYVMLSVTDSGAGMSAEVRERIFEPFFTTKELGRGTGLGLATVYGIVKQHGGHIIVDSEPGKGTIFRILLPLTAGPGPQQAAEPSGPLPEGTETLLVVEDDELVRGLIDEVLAPLGYRVLTTASGDEALKTSDSFPGHVDLLLTDVVMPGMNGRQLAEVMRTRRPGIKVLFMSGYTQDALSTQGILEPGVALIHKPLRAGTLARQIRQVLDSVG